MEIKVSKATIIDHCDRQCPHFDIDGGPGGAMVCEHPELKKKYKRTHNLSVFYIISHPECDDGFPKKCPLLTHKKRVRKSKEITERSSLDKYEELLRVVCNRLRRKDHLLKFETSRHRESIHFKISFHI